MKYLVTFHENDFEISDQKNNKKTKVYYGNCFGSEASAHIKGVQYKIKPRDFWGNEFILSQNGVQSGKISINWQGNLQLEVGESVFVLKEEGIVNHQYILSNLLGEEILSIKPDFEWKSFKEGCEVAKIGNHENATLLVFMASFGVHYFEANLYL